MKKLVKPLLILAGSLSLAIGLIGIFVPGLPTTPFILLTAACYLKSSDRLYNWVDTHKIFGPYLHKVKDGLSVKTKIVTTLIMWCMILISVFFIFEHIHLKLFLIFIGVVGTVTKFVFFRKKNENI